MNNKKTINIWHLFAMMILLCSCKKIISSTQKSDSIATLEKKVEELKPGLGEIMGVIQQHHSKLYFAGNSQNWELSQYQLDEIREGLEDVTKYHPKFHNLPINELEVAIMNKPLDEMAYAIQQKEKKSFLRAYDGLTTSCNSCHQAAEHAYIIIQAPQVQEFGNQKFTQ